MNEDLRAELAEAEAYVPEDRLTFREAELVRSILRRVNAWPEFLRTPVRELIEAALYEEFPRALHPLHWQADDRIAMLLERAQR